MSKLRKHVTQSALHEYPEPTSSQSIVRSVANRGTNQFEVEYANGEKILVMMPQKFRNLIWIKRGDFMIIKTDTSAENRGKIKGIIEHVLMPHHIRHLKQVNMWPSEFEDNEQEQEQEEGDEEDEDGDPFDDPLFHNPNRDMYSSDEDES